MKKPLHLKVTHHGVVSEYHEWEPVKIMAFSIAVMYHDHEEIYASMIADLVMDLYIEIEDVRLGKLIDFVCEEFDAETTDYDYFEETVRGWVY